jgi:hypothetical protein
MKMVSLTCFEESSGGIEDLRCVRLLRLQGQGFHLQLKGLVVSVEITCPHLALISSLFHFLHGATQTN